MVSVVTVGLIKYMLVSSSKNFKNFPNYIWVQDCTRICTNTRRNEREHPHPVLHGERGPPAARRACRRCTVLSLLCAGHWTSMLVGKALYLGFLFRQTPFLSFRYGGMAHSSLVCLLGGVLRVGGGKPGSLLGLDQQNALFAQRRPVLGGLDVVSRQQPTRNIFIFSYLVFILRWDTSAAAAAADASVDGGFGRLDEQLKCLGTRGVISMQYHHHHQQHLKKEPWVGSPQVDLEHRIRADEGLAG